MKLYKLFSLGLLAVGLSACDKALEQGLDDADIFVELNDQVVSDGQIITVSRILRSGLISTVIRIM